MASHAEPLLQVMESIDKIMQKVYDDLADEDLDGVEAAYKAVEETMKELMDAIDEIEEE